uniref:Uncharacterized protein n=1 Tax=Psilocybe cubensis TaxID=181762 RepID=A0A8H7XU87_PSICU
MLGRIDAAYRMIEKYAYDIRFGVEVSHEHEAYLDSLHRGITELISRVQKDLYATDQQSLGNSLLTINEVNERTQATLSTMASKLDSALSILHCRRRSQTLDTEENGTLNPSNARISWCPIDNDDGDEALLNMITSLHEELHIEEDLVVDSAGTPASEKVVPQWCFHAEQDKKNLGRPFQWLYTFLSRS